MEKVEKVQFKFNILCTRRKIHTTSLYSLHTYFDLTLAQLSPSFLGGVPEGSLTFIGGFVCVCGVTENLHTFIEARLAPVSSVLT